MRLANTVALASILAVSSSNVFAATQINTSFQVKVQILSACSVDTPSTLDFGQQTSLALNTDNTTGVTVTCSLTTPYTVSLDAGVNGGGTVTTRKMKGVNGGTVSYGLYSDATRLTTWGNVSTNWVTGIGTSLPITHTVYGRIPTQTTPAPDTFTDTIQVTVSY